MRTAYITAGFLAQEEIHVVYMPREDFLDTVEELLDSGDYPSIRDEIMPIAATMVRFPMGTWINETRGCGCVVGEYLVATGEIDRAAAAREQGEGTFAVERLLEENPHGRELFEFGNDIDDALVRILLRNDIQPYGIDAIEIEDS